MKNISQALFRELRNTAARIDVGWLIIREDGQRFAFTSSDVPFVYNGDTYSPTNGFNPSAIVSKADFSVDNMECQVLENDLITDNDLRGGLWDNAQVNVFWICRYHPEWGIVPLRGGRLGQIVIKQNTWNTQLRSLFDQLQQPFGYFYTLQCGAELGDSRCGVKLSVPTWTASQQYTQGLLTDAKVGSMVKPTVENGFWYAAQYTQYGISNITANAGEAAYAPGDTAGQLIAALNPQSDAESLVNHDNPNLANYLTTLLPGQTAVPPTTLDYGGQPSRRPTIPGQGLSGNDDLGPNDNTQIGVGAGPSGLSEYTFEPPNVDIFGLKI